MKVRVKNGKSGFIYGVYRTEGQEFTLKPVKGFKKTADGPLEETTISVNNQFSDNWMEKIDGRKKSAPEPDESEPDESVAE